MQNLEKKMLWMAMIMSVVCIVMIIVAFKAGTYVGGAAWKQLAYKHCRAFNFMAYIHTETIRHYQNSTFELTALPNCEVYYAKSVNITGSYTYDEFMLDNNLTHLNWSEDAK